MKIEITQQDIDQGERFCSSRCPIALAFRRVLNPFWVSVGPRLVAVEKTPDVWDTYEMPGWVEGWILAFDHPVGRGPVTPVEFEADLVYGEDE